MSITQLMQGADGAKHFTNVESSVRWNQVSSIVQQGSEVTTRNKLHGQKDLFSALEGIQQFHQPFASGVGQDISFSQHMFSFVEFDQQVFVQNLESTDLFRVLLLGQEHLSVATLAHLGYHFEVLVFGLQSSFSQVGSFSADVVFPLHVLQALVVTVQAIEVSKDLFRSLFSGYDVVELVTVVVKKVQLTNIGETLGFCRELNGGLSGLLVSGGWSRHAISGRAVVQDTLCWRGR